MVKLILFIILICIISVVIWSNADRKPFKEDELQQNFDLNKYVKKQYWYQYKYIPNSFQTQCKDNVRAEYNFTGVNEISVINTCDGKDGYMNVAEGFAYPYGSNKLKVSFAPKFLSYFDKFIQLFGDYNFTTGDYYIISSDSETYAMVGSTDRKMLWILTSEKDKKPDNYDELVTKASKLGYPVQLLE